MWKGESRGKKRPRPTKSSTSLVKITTLCESSKSPPLLGLSQDPEQQAVCFYFINIHPRLRGYWHEDLDLFLRSEGPSSLLSLAVSALSCIFTCLHPEHLHFEQIAIARYAKLLQLAREAASDPNIVASDNFLMVVCLLGTWEVAFLHCSMPRSKILIILSM